MLTIVDKLIISALTKVDYKPISIAKAEWFDPKERVRYDFVKAYYKEHGELPSVEVFRDRYHITAVSAPGRPAYFLKELKNRYIASSLATAIPKIMASLGTDPEKGLEDLQKSLFHLKTDTYTSKDVSYADDAKERYDSYAKRVSTKGVVHLSSGVLIFDKTFYGYRTADLITIGGRAGVGKSWLLIYLAIQLEYVLKVTENTQPILFISNEMPEDEVIERIDCMSFGLPYEEFMLGKLSRSERIRYKEALAKLAIEGSLIKVAYNCSTIEELTVLIDIYTPAAVFIDGSYMMEPDQGEGWEKITFITRNLKRICKVKATPIINTTQLKRATGKAGSKMSIDGQDDFAYSQSYSQDSDIAMRMFQTADMVFNAEIGIEIVKGRRVKPDTRYVFTNNLTTMVQKIKLEEIKTKKEVIW